MEHNDGTLGCDEKNGCIHYWIIDQLNYGVCKKCGAEKHFPNTYGQILKWKSRKTESKST